MTARVLLGVAVWLVLALLAGASGSLAGLRSPFAQVVLAGLTLALLALFRWSPPVQTWALTVDMRALVLGHLSRLVGIYFLILHGRGLLPWAFAVPGGWGDIAVATAALLVALGAPRRGARGWAIYTAWNVAGLVDILLVVTTAARLGVAEPGSMRALTVLPLSLLPTFLVPIIIATHVVIWARLGASRRAGYRAFCGPRGAARGCRAASRSERRRRQPSCDPEAGGALGGQDEQLSRRRGDAGEGRDVDLVGHENQVPALGPLAHPRADRAGLLGLAGAIPERRIEGRPRLDAAEGEPGRLEAAAPAARQDQAHREAAGPERGADPPRLLPAGGRQIPLGRAVVQPEAGRIADAGVGRGVPQQDDPPAGPEERPERLVGVGGARQEEKRQEERGQHDGLRRARP